MDKSVGNVVELRITPPAGSPVPASFVIVRWEDGTLGIESNAPLHPEAAVQVARELLMARSQARDQEAWEATALTEVESTRPPEPDTSGVTRDGDAMKTPSRRIKLAQLVGVEQGEADAGLDVDLMPYVVEEFDHWTANKRWNRVCGYRTLDGARRAWPEAEVTPEAAALHARETSAPRNLESVMKPVDAADAVIPPFENPPAVNSWPDTRHSPAYPSEQPEATPTPLAGLPEIPDDGKLSPELVAALFAAAWEAWPNQLKRGRAAAAFAETVTTKAEALLFARVQAAYVEQAVNMGVDGDTLSYTFFRQWPDHLALLDKASPAPPAPDAPPAAAGPVVATPAVAAAPPKRSPFTIASVPAYKEQAAKPFKALETIGGGPTGRIVDRESYDFLGDAEAAHPGALVSPATRDFAAKIKRVSRPVNTTIPPKPRQVICLNIEDWKTKAIDPDRPFLYAEITSRGDKGESVRPGSAYEYLSDAVVAQPDATVEDGVREFAEQVSRVNDGGQVIDLWLAGTGKRPYGLFDKIIHADLPNDQPDRAFESLAEARTVAPSARVSALARTYKPTKSEPASTPTTPNVTGDACTCGHVLGDHPKGGPCIYNVGGHCAGYAPATATPTPAKGPERKIDWRGQGEDFPFGVYELRAGKWKLFKGYEYLNRAKGENPGAKVTQDAEDEANDRKLHFPG